MRWSICACILLLNSTTIFSQELASSKQEYLQNPNAFEGIFLKKAELDSIPEWMIEHHQKIKYLYFKKTKVKSWSNLNQLDSLVSFRCNDCEIIDFPKGICSMPNLKLIEIARCDMKEVPECVCELPLVEEFLFWDTQVYRMPICINWMENLKLLDLQGVMINEDEYFNLLSAHEDIKLNLSTPCDCKFDRD